MRDISNKLHALVDEFVSNLSSECVSLANTVSAQAHLYQSADNAAEITPTQRSANRTAAEVLNGLKRPSGVPGTDSPHTELKSRMSHAKGKVKEGYNRTRDGGRFSADVEVLSSDHSSDDCPRPTIKFPKKLQANKRGAKARNSRSRGHSPGLDNMSPLRSHESSHPLDYGYEGDTKSVGATINDVENTFNKLRWPEHIEEVHEDGGDPCKIVHSVVKDNKDSTQQDGGPNRDDDNILQEGDESNEDDIGHNTAETNSDGEDLLVLPKVPVKRRLLNEARAHERRTQRGKAKSPNPQMKKHKTPQIDASVITQLEFGRRPANSVSTTTH